MSGTQALAVGLQATDAEPNDALRRSEGPTVGMQLIAEAEAALGRGPYSVIDKTMVPPSGNIRDYFHPAPYFWPNPNTRSGLPYVMRDGVRVPGTHMYEENSERYDRTRVQRVFDDTRILTLAWQATGERRYLDHAHAITLRFFVAPQTRMTRHLKFAQVRMGHNDNIGTPAGLIEMKDFYFHLEAIRQHLRAGIYTEAQRREFRAWLNAYLNWLLSSKQGKKECVARNNHGLYYDLQVASISAILGEDQLMRQAITRAIGRMGEHFSADGAQPHELTRATTQHYCCFNLQGWINLAAFAARHGYDLWSYRAPNGVSLKVAAEWLLALAGGHWPYRQIEPFDSERFLPIWFAAKAHGVTLDPPDGIGDPMRVKPLFHPHDGIKPFWQLA